MAGYFLYSLDGDAFSRLTTTPTDAQAAALARPLLTGSDWDDGRNGLAAAGWPTDLPGLTAFLKSRLAAADWDAGLTADGSGLWCEVVDLFGKSPGEACGLGYRAHSDREVSWDVSEFCAARGAPTLTEPAFGNRGFRASRPDHFHEYSLHPPDRVAALLSELRTVEPHAAALPDDAEGSVWHQFFHDLLPVVERVAAAGRVLWVRTDT